MAQEAMGVLRWAFSHEKCSFKTLCVGFSAIWVVFGALVLFLPGESYGFPGPSGFHLYQQDFCEEPKLGVTHDSASPMGFAGAGDLGTGSWVDWTAKTYNPLFVTVDLYAFMLINMPGYGLNNVILSFDSTGGVHLLSEGGIFPYALGVKAIDEAIFTLPGIVPGPGDLILFGFAMVKPGQQLLEFKDVTLWWAPWPASATQGACYDNRKCEGRPLRRPTTKQQCACMDGKGWLSGDDGICYPVN